MVFPIKDRQFWIANDGNLGFPIKKKNVSAIVRRWQT